MKKSSRRQKPRSARRKQKSGSRRLQKTRKQKRRIQRGGVSGLPEGYPSMVVSYTPKDTDKLQTHDEIPRVGSIAEYEEHVGEQSVIPEEAEDAAPEASQV